MQASKLLYENMLTNQITKLPSKLASKKIKQAK